MLCRAAGDLPGPPGQGVTVRNCLITGNASSGTTPNGGGVCNSTVQSSTVCGNSADGSGGGIYGGTILNSVVYFNSALDGPNYSGGAYTYSCATPMPAGAGNITDPLLVNDPANNYRLTPGSHCLDAGSKTTTRPTAAAAAESI